MPALTERGRQDFVWVQQNTQGRKGAQSTRHLQRLANISRKSQTRKTKLTTEEDAKSPAPQQSVSLSRGGAMVFLNATQEDYGESETGLISPPPMPVDSICTAVCHVDDSMKTVFRYIRTAWLPSSDSIPTSGIFGAFSPVWSDDGTIADDLLTYALQSPGSLSLYAMLTVGSRRLARLTAMDTSHLRKPEYYALRAVQGLRKIITTKDLSNDQIILDLSFLVLGEIYARSPYEIEGMPVYWAMIRHCIVQCGGILGVRPRALRFVLSIDSLFNGLQLIAPQLGLLQHPELIGWPSQGTCPDDSNLLENIDNTIAALDDRSRTLCLASQRRNEVVQALHDLPSNTIEHLRLLIKQHARPFIIIFSTTPLFPSNPGGRAPNYSPACARADMLYNQARSNTVNLWYWFSALEHLGPDHVPDFWLTPNAIESAETETWSYIIEIRQLLEDGPWHVNPNIVLWMSVIGFVVAELASVRERHKELVLEMASELNVGTTRELMEAIKSFLPLYTLNLSRLRDLWPDSTHMSNVYD